jgi:hypothetical protein
VLFEELDKEDVSKGRIMQIERGDWMKIDEQLITWKGNEETFCNYMSNVLTKEIILVQNDQKYLINFIPDEIELMLKFERKCLITEWERYFPFLKIDEDEIIFL